jgi:glycosyltransferase involved in cell wall biosynthesis
VTPEAAGTEHLARRADAPPVPHECAGNGSRPGALDLAVVVPSVSGWQDLSGCLEALEANERDVKMEVLVADRCGEELRGQIARRFPRVRVLPAPARTSIPDLRARGFAAAGADAVAVIEDHVLVPPDWARRLLVALQDGAEVVGGSVSNAATDTCVDWAAFLCEYSHLLRPLTAGPSETLTGNNTVYRRALLDRYRAETEAGRFEDHLHRAFRRDGITLVCHPEIEVAHKKHYTVGGYLIQRYLYARSYAGARLSGTSWPSRIGYAVAAGALPPVLFLRIVSRAATRPGYRNALAKSLPLIALFVVGWAAGEMVGALGGPGDALSRVS